MHNCVNACDREDYNHTVIEVNILPPVICVHKKHTINRVCIPEPTVED